jgi:hypothetical protein
MERARLPRRLGPVSPARLAGLLAAAGLVVATVTAAGLAATHRAAVAPQNTQPPIISGTTQVGSNLMTTDGTWSGTTPLTYTYQWQRCDQTGGSCADISGATTNTYALKAVDSGNTLRVAVTAKNADGTASSTSVPTAVVTTAAPTPPSNTGCPAATTGVASIGDLSPPARLQIVGFSVPTGPINAQTQSFTLRVRVGSTCGVGIQGASVYVTAVPYNQFNIPAEQLTGTDGVASLSFSRLSGFPASSRQQQLTFFVRATKPGEDVLAGVSTRRLIAVSFSR